MRCSQVVFMATQADVSSPTAVEQGFGQIPCPPSTNSSTSGRNEQQQVFLGKGGFVGKGNNQGVAMQGKGGNYNPGMSPMMQGNVGQGTQIPTMAGAPGLQFGTGNGNCFNPSMCSNGLSQFGAQSMDPRRFAPYCPVPSGVPCQAYGQVPSQCQGVGQCFSQIPGGMTPQMSNVRQIVDLLQTLDGNQTRVLQQMVAERVATQTRGIPEVFGENVRQESEPFIPDASRPVWDGQDLGFYGDKPQLDVFSKTEKWLSPAPVPQVDQWKGREQEVLGWNDYMTQLVSWASQASEIFANEISQSSRWHSVIGWSTLSGAQRSRSSRLFAILKGAFNNHPRTSMLISVFSEGLNLQEHVIGTLPVSQANANGFELVRQLTLEFSLKTRGEALGMRSSLASKSFVLSAAETSVGTLVTDTIRKLDFECSRYVKMLSTLPPSVDSTGLALPEADMLLMLLRSLPQQVRDFCLHHASGETFMSYRQAARRWEQQQRIFQEMTQTQGGRKPVSQLAGQELNQGVEHYDMSEQDWPGELCAVSDNKCQKCGSKKHSTVECSTDLSKTKCFRCNGFGHVSMNCHLKKPEDSKGHKGNSYDKGKGNPKGYPKGGPKGGFKGNAKGNGKNGKGNRKGKLYEMTEESDDWWCYDWGWDESEKGIKQVTWWDGWDGTGGEDGWWGPESWEPEHTAEASETTEPTVGSLLLSPVLCFDDVSKCENGLFLECCNHENPERHVDSDVSDGIHENQDVDEKSAEVESFEFSFPQPFSEKGVPLVSCDSCPQPFHDMLCTCGLKCSIHDEGDNWSGDHLEGLICETPMRTKVVKLRVPTCLNHEGEISACHEWSKFEPLVLPLLSEIGMKDDHTWWLLDSGAAVTVLAKHLFVCYAAEKVGETDDSRFSAANGSSVKMHGKAEVSVFMNLWHDQRHENVWKKAKLVALVGETRHNILSTTALSQTGWTFSQKDGVAKLFHEKSGFQACEVVSFAGCPWVRLHPHSGLDRQHEEVKLSEEVSDFGNVCPLSKAARNELEQHRNQGHTPHNPNCLECSRGRSTFQHRRRDGDCIESEIQADFGFLSQQGEVSEIEASGAIRVLVLTETVSNAIGYVVVEDDLNRTRSAIVRWLKHFGMESERYSIVLHTDAEQAVRNLVGGVSPQFTFQVRKAGNQQHQSVGAAERGVRRLKETLAVLRADLNKHDVDIRFDKECIGEALNYLALSHNHYGKTRETNMSPLEVLAGRRLTKPVSAMFGSTVLAELPSSLRQKCPNETRSVEAAFISIGIDKGPMVMGSVRIDQEFHLMLFAARNVRQITPISWDLKLCDSFLAPMPEAVGDVPRDPPQAAPPPPVGPAIGGEELPDIPGFDDDDGGLPPMLEPARGGQHPEVEARVRGQKVEREKSHDDRNPKKLRVEDGRSESRPGYIRTRHCPACESGMVAPGIRHSATCRRVNQPVVVASSRTPATAADFPDMDVDDVEIPQETEFLERTKRTRDPSSDEVETQIKRERKDEVFEIFGENMSLGMFWETTAEPVTTILDLNELTFLPATEPGLLLENLSSIKFDSGVEHESTEVSLCGTRVLIWKPTEAIDDSTLAVVNHEQCFVGMCEEVTNMTKCDVGSVLNNLQVESLKKLKPQTRVISSRWVVAKKSAERVRARVVAKDINRGVAARAMGYSSPTPSTESLNMVLTWAALHDWRLTSLDISHAFMHSPLPDSETIILKLPQSISLIDGSPGFLLLKRALNGLRDASLHWLNLLAKTIRAAGVWSDSLEPCVYQGSVSKKNQMVGLVALVVYVDDILVISSNVEAEKVIHDAIAKVVPTKTTGVIFPSGEGGGDLTFIGRRIHRKKGDAALYVSVDPEYLRPCFEDYQIKRGTTAAPDVASFLEKSDEVSLRPLTAEGYGKFRKSLGKMLWLAQVRHDLKLWLSLIGSVQAKPTVGGDNALKAILRFLYLDRHVQLRMPSESTELTDESSYLVSRLHVWSDASHAPYRFNGRRGVSGEVVAYMNSVIRTVAKQQQSVSLSSCEAELFAIQMAAQDSVGLSRFTQRFLFGLGEIDEAEPVDLLLESDSLSAIQLLEGVDLPRKSRHVEVRVMWLKSKMEEKQLRIQHRYGVGNCADLFTKCLSTKDFLRLRSVLGFESLEQPLESLAKQSEESSIDQIMQIGNFRFALVEVCCLEKSCLNLTCEKLDIPYLGIVANMQSDNVIQKFKRHVGRWKKQGFHVHVHISTPCTAGFPLKHFNPGSNDEEVEAVWLEIMSCASQYFEHGITRSFELPASNAIWNRSETKDVLEQASLTHGCEVFLCQTGLSGKSGAPVGKVLVFRSNCFEMCKYLHRRFGNCKCEAHASLGDVVFSKSGNYTMALAKGIVRGAVLATRRL